MEKSKYTCEYCGAIVIQDPKLKRRPYRTFCDNFCRKSENDKLPKLEINIAVPTLFKIMDLEKPEIIDTENPIKTKKESNPYNVQDAEKSWIKILGCVDRITHKYRIPNPLSIPPQPQSIPKSLNPEKHGTFILKMEKGIGLC